MVYRISLFLTVLLALCACKATEKQIASKIEAIKQRHKKDAEVYLNNKNTYALLIERQEKIKSTYQVPTKYYVYRVKDKTLVKQGETTFSTLEWVGTRQLKMTFLIGEEREGSGKSSSIISF